MGTVEQSGQRPGNRQPDVRVGDTERERAIILLGEHFSAGRLDVHEYDQRCAQASAARFRSDIRVLFTDLPEPHPEVLQTPRTPVSPSPAKPSLRMRGGLLALAIVAALILFAVVARQPWLLAPVAFVGVFWWPRGGDR